MKAIRPRGARVVEALESVAINATVLLGLASFTHGVYLWSEPGAWLTGGTFAVVVALLIERERK